MNNKLKFKFVAGVFFSPIAMSVCGMDYSMLRGELQWVEIVQAETVPAVGVQVGVPVGEGESRTPLSSGDNASRENVGEEKRQGEELLNDSTAVDCLVEVRAIKAFQRGADFRAKRLQTGRMLVDVKSQLEPLPFKRYQVLQSFLKRVSLNDQVSFDLLGAEGETNYLIVRPESMFGNRVQVMVNWKDEAGADLLSSELKVINNQNVVLGTDRAEDRSTIVSIKLNCD